MILNNQTYIRHKNKPEWGIGKVTQVLSQEKFSAFFVNKGFKKLIYSPDYIQIETEIDSHPLLDNIDLAKAKISSTHTTLKQMVDIFLQIFPQGFNDKRYYIEERKYKLDASEKLTSLLSRDNFQKLLDEENFEEIIRHCLSVTNKTNLIFPNEKMDLKDGLKSPANQEMFSKSLFQLLYGDQSLEVRFMGFANTLNSIKANKWTTQTYFLYLSDPEKYLFMKPTITRKAAGVCKFELNYKPQLNWKTYLSLQEFGKYFMTELSTQGENLTPKDMIDVQSFFWSVANADDYKDDEQGSKSTVTSLNK